jgi:hypothetical protein
MRPVTSSELLTVWEREMNQSLIQKTLILLSHANPEMQFEDIAKLSIGKRDAMLFQLRKWMFGTRLVNTAYCPKCNVQIEWETEIGDLDVLDKTTEQLQDEYSVKIENFNIRFRLPNTNDFKYFSGSHTSNFDRKTILSNCIAEVTKDLEDFEISKLPDKVFNALEDYIEQIDSHADIRMVLTCPNCSNRWESSFDIISYLWAEIDSWAKNVLQEVAFLARNFGWSEQQILAMSPKRREMYLEMLIS